jgi:hypothetical protein
MTDYILSFEDFELPFVHEVQDYPDENEEESEDFSFDTSDQKALMEEALPVDYYFLGTIDTNVSTWSMEADYYLLPLKDESFDWALIRINWDDNWGRWDWAFDARLKGLKDQPLEAARLMLTELWKTWNIDLSNREDRAYKNFLAQMENPGFIEGE